MKAINEKYRFLAASLLQVIKRESVGLQSTDGIIKEVDLSDFTCTVECNGSLIDDVPLKILKGSQASFLEIPKVNSDCIVSFRNGNIHRPQIEKVFEVENFKILVDNIVLDLKKDSIDTEIDNTKFSIKKDGFLIERNSNSLKKTLQDILDELTKMKVVTPAGTGVVDPSNITNFTKYKTELDNYLI